MPRHFTAAERRARQQLRPDVSASRSRACSEASSGASPSTSAATSAAQAGRREIPQSPLAAKLFENVRPLEEAAASSSGSSGAAEASTAASTTADRVLSAVGNSIFFGLLGTGSFFGYYTLKYDADQIQTMVDETKKAENAFPGSQVTTSEQVFLLLLAMQVSCTTATATGMEQAARASAFQQFQEFPSELVRLFCTRSCNFGSNTPAGLSM